MGDFVELDKIAVAHHQVDERGAFGGRSRAPVNVFWLRESRYFVNPLPQQAIRRRHEKIILARTSATSESHKSRRGRCDYTNARRASYVFSASHQRCVRIQRALMKQLHTPHASSPTRFFLWRSLSWADFVAHALRVFGAVFAIAFAVNTSAADSKVEVQLLAEVKTSASAPDGSQVARFAPAATLSQGEVVYYTVRILNPTSEYLRDVIVTQPIPANTTYSEHSAAGPGTEIQFSADGGLTFAPEGRVLTTDSGGVQRPATAQDLTHIRWRLRNALAPGAVALARFQAVFR